MNILVVEDSNSVSEMITATIRNGEHGVEISETGKNADIARTLINGRIVRSIDPSATSPTPVTMTTRPPSPVAASRIAV